MLCCIGIGYILPKCVVEYIMLNLEYMLTISKIVSIGYLKFFMKVVVLYN